MEEVHHHHHHPYQQQQQQQESVNNGRLALNKSLLSSSMASMASLAAGTAPAISNNSLPPQSNGQPSHLCAGCGHPIKDRYLLQVF